MGRLGNHEFVRHCVRECDGGTREGYVRERWISCDERRDDGPWEEGEERDSSNMKKGGCRAIELDVDRPELPGTGSSGEYERY